MVTKICEVCQKPFTVRPYRQFRARFCSQSCGGKWHLSQREMPSGHKWGNQWRKGLRPTNAFTPEQARRMNEVQPVKLNCAQCQKEFTKKPWEIRTNKTKSGRKFCSKKCHSLYMQNNGSGSKSPQWVGGPTTYRGKGWVVARAFAVQRDGGKCQSCGKLVGSSIPVHHIKPFRLFKNPAEANQLQNLVCLCQSCHMKREVADPHGDCHLST